MSRVPTTSAVGEEETSTSKEDISLEQKIGMAKKFDREMKDYAKATVKEFLGIYGYEEDVDINMEDSETQKGETSTSQNATGTDKPTESESSTSTASTMTSMCKAEKGTGTERPVSSVSISSSTTNGNADMTRFCITMSIPRPGADSLESYTTLRFWNCIMCSTAFIGTKPEIIQRVHHPQLFTYQPEWLSHAGICNRCQKTLTMQTPKITIYAISETPQIHQGYNGSTSPVPRTSIPGASIPRTSIAGVTMPGASIPGTSIPGASLPGASMPGSSVPEMHVPGTFVPGTYMPRASLPVVMCSALPGQCNCAHGGHNPVPGATHLAYPVVNVPVVSEAKQACAETGYKTQVTQYTPITCTQ